MSSSSSWSQAVQSLSSGVLDWSGLCFLGSSQGLTPCSSNQAFAVPSEQLAANSAGSDLSPCSSLNPMGTQMKLSKLPWKTPFLRFEGRVPPTPMLLPKEWGRAHSMPELSPKSLTSSPTTLTCLYFQGGWRVKKRIMQLVSEYLLWSFCLMFGVYSIPCLSTSFKTFRNQNFWLHQNHQPGILFPHLLLMGTHSFSPQISGQASLPPCLCDSSLV